MYRTGPVSQMHHAERRRNAETPQQTGFPAHDVASTDGIATAASTIQHTFLSLDKAVPGSLLLRQESIETSSTEPPAPSDGVLIFGALRTSKTEDPIHFFLPPLETVHRASRHRMDTWGVTGIVIRNQRFQRLQCEYTASIV